MITMDDTGECSDHVKYLAWQKPAWDESGYFWTGFYVIPEVLHLSTDEHPFIFDSEVNANNHAEKLNLHGYVISEVNIDLLRNLTPTHPDNHCYKPGIAIEVMCKLMV
jgi:hypothetical protein